MRRVAFLVVLAACDPGSVCDPSPEVACRSLCGPVERATVENGHTLRCQCGPMTVVTRELAECR